MNSATDPEPPVFMPMKTSVMTEICHLLKVSNVTVDDEKDQIVDLVERHCSEDAATDMTLCMKRRRILILLIILITSLLCMYVIVSIHPMCLATPYADFMTIAGLRVTMNDNSPLVNASSAKGVFDCGLKCRRMKGCLGYNFNSGTKKCELLKVQSMAKRPKKSSLSAQNMVSVIL